MHNGLLGLGLQMHNSLTPASAYFHGNSIFRTYFHGGVRFSKLSRSVHVGTGVILYIIPSECAIIHYIPRTPLKHIRVPYVLTAYTFIQQKQLCI